VYKIGDGCLLLLHCWGRGRPAGSLRVRPASSGASSNHLRWFVRANICCGVLDRPVKPSDDSREAVFQTAIIILAAGFARAVRLISRPEIRRAQGKPDASRIRWPCVQSEMKMHTSFSHHRRSRTSGFPCAMNFTAYASISICPGVDHSTRRWRERPFTTSSSGWTTLPSRRLTPLVPASPGFAVRFLPRSSCASENDRFIRNWVSRPRDHSDAPKTVGVHRIRSAQATMANAPLSGPEQLDIYTRS